MLIDAHLLTYMRNDAYFFRTKFANSWGFPYYYAAPDKESIKQLINDVIEKLRT